VVGLETAVSVMMDRLVGQGIITLMRLIDLFSTGPCRVLGVPGGCLATGGPADITVLDPGKEVTVDASKFHSKGRNTPFDGWRLKGTAVATIVGGDIVYREI
jgi:dihydroorotase